MVYGSGFRIKGVLFFYPHGASTIEVEVEETQVERQGTRRNGL